MQTTTTATATQRAHRYIIHGADVPTRASLTTTTSRLFTLWRAYVADEDPITELYGSEIPAAVWRRYEAQMQREAREMLAADGWTPFLFEQSLTARLGGNTMHRLGLDSMLAMLFPDEV